MKEGRYVGALYPPTHIHAFEPNAFKVLARLIQMDCEAIHTYAPSDPFWLPPFDWTGPWHKALAHRIAACSGHGENIAMICRSPG